MSSSSSFYYWDSSYKFTGKFTDNLTSVRLNQNFLNQLAYNIRSMTSGKFSFINLSVKAKVDPPTVHIFTRMHDGKICVTFTPIHSKRAFELVSVVNCLLYVEALVINYMHGLKWHDTVYTYEVSFDKKVVSYGMPAHFETCLEYVSKTKPEVVQTIPLDLWLS